MEGRARVESVKASQAADWALSQGISALVTAELAELLGVPADQVRRRLHAPAQRGEWVMPVRGLWVPVAPEYRTWGAPPGIELVDLMMGHLDVSYYVGWLSAAAIHGASHQVPQVFQVAVDRLVRSRTIGRTRFDFAQRDVSRIPTVEFPTRSGGAKVSTLAATMLDVAADPGNAGGLDNAATVIIELAESDAFRVAEIGGLVSRFSASAVRRLGYILDRFTDAQDLTILAGVVCDAARPSRLDPNGVASGPVDHRWMVYVNREVDPDI